MQSLGIEFRHHQMAADAIYKYQITAAMDAESISDHEDPTRSKPWEKFLDAAIKITDMASFEDFITNSVIIKTGKYGIRAGSDAAELFNHCVEEYYKSVTELAYSDPLKDTDTIEDLEAIPDGKTFMSPIAEHSSGRDAIATYMGEILDRKQEGYMEAQARERALAAQRLLENFVPEAAATQKLGDLRALIKKHKSDLQLTVTKTTSKIKLQAINDCEHCMDRYLIGATEALAGHTKPLDVDATLSVMSPRRNKNNGINSKGESHASFIKHDRLTPPSGTGKSKH